VKAALGLLLLGFTLLGCDNFIDGQVFFPQRKHDGQPADFGLASREVNFTTADGLRLNGWYLPAPGAVNLLLFCHGNAGNISHRLDNLRLLHRAGIAVFIFDYRGYGLSRGKPSEAGMYQDAEAAWLWAREQAESQGGRVVIFGRSLGGVAATYLAAGHQPAGLILESTFTNLGAMAKSLMPLPGLEGWLKGRFNSLDRAPSVGCPVLMLHGDRDRTVPYRLGQKLFEALPQPKRFITLPGAGHNDTYVVGGPAYFDRLARFVDEPG
jgi:fermentation-respiration switch protein FrsA (DUF1100 family)